jgi:glycosyltransferase involved in cell wall biosynthesis
LRRQEKEKQLCKKPTLFIVSHTPIVAHFFFRNHIQALKAKFNVLLVHNAKLDKYCPSLDELCEIKSIPIQRKITPLFDMWVIFQIMGLIIKYRPKIVISVTPKAGFLGMLASRLLKVKVRLHIFQGEIWPNRAGILKRILMLCDAMIIKNSNYLLCVSQSEKKLLTNTFSIKREKIEVLGHGTICGVRPVFFQSGNVQENMLEPKKYKPKGVKICAYLGRICEEKGIKDLINAFYMLDHRKNDKMLIFIGPEENFSIADELKNFPINFRELVLTFPFVENPQVLLSGADFLCLPSHREGFGLSIIEAAAMGIPAIGTKIVGITDAIVENETGLLCELKNPHDLAKCMQVMFDNDVLRQRLGNNAKLRAEKYFEQSKVVARYTEYICNLS